MANRSGNLGEWEKVEQNRAWNTKLFFLCNRALWFGKAKIPSPRPPAIDCICSGSSAGMMRLPSFSQVKASQTHAHVLFWRAKGIGKSLKTDIGKVASLQKIFFEGEMEAKLSDNPVTVNSQELCLFEKKKLSILKHWCLSFSPSIYKIYLVIS